MRVCLASFLRKVQYCRPAYRVKQPGFVFDKSQLLRKLEARKAMWKPEVNIDVDRLLDSGPVAAGIDLVIEDDEKASQDQEYPTLSSSPSNGEDRGASVGTESKEEDASQPTERECDAKGRRESSERLAASEAADAAAPCVLAGAYPPQQSHEANLCSIAVDSASGKGLPTDGRSLQQAEDRACAPTQPSPSAPCEAGAAPLLSEPAHGQDNRHSSEPRIPTAIEHSSALEGPQVGAGRILHGSPDNESGSGAGQHQLHSEGHNSGDDEEMDEDEENEMNLAEAHQENSESLADDFEDDEADEADSADEGSQGVEDPGEHEEELADEGEGGYDEDDEEAELLAAIQRERKMQNQLQGRLLFATF